MCWRSLLLIAFATGNAVAAEDYILGAGGHGDSADGLAGSVIAEIALNEQTWLSGSIGANTVELPRGQSLDTVYGDLGIDRWFDPFGVRVGGAYWGDSNILDSRDLRASVYWRAEHVTLAGDYEYRDFRFTVPAAGQFPGRTFDFDANGVGLTTRFELSDTVSLSLSGMSYDYSVNLRLDDNRGILDLLSISRLSLINSLVDHSAFALLGLDRADNRWQLEVGAWKGAVDGNRTRSATVHFMTPIGKRSDIEFGLGIDDSEAYGRVMFFSVFLYFYGD